MKLIVYSIIIILYFIVHTLYEVFLRSEEPQIYILIGAPGAGKSTWAKHLQEKKYKHIYPSDLLRERLKKGDTRYLVYKEEIESGSPGIPGDVVTRLVKEVLDEVLTKDPSSKIVLDGYPRSVEQAHFLESYLSTYALEKKKKALYLDVDRAVCFQRIFFRRECKSCHDIYNLKFRPPQINNMCDKCKLSLYQRSGDNVEKINARLDRFYNWGPAVLDFYRKKGELIPKVQ